MLELKGRGSWLWPRSKCHGLCLVEADTGAGLPVLVRVRGDDVRLRTAIRKPHHGIDVTIPISITHSDREVTLEFNLEVNSIAVRQFVGLPTKDEGVVVRRDKVDSRIGSFRLIDRQILPQPGDHRLARQVFDLRWEIVIDSIAAPRGRGT